MQNLKRRRLGGGGAANWSKLCRDVLVIVLERLSATDFDRAKAVCTAWFSASRESSRKQNQIPWLILLPYERSYGYSCRLLNPAEKRFVYRSRNLGVEFTQSRCVATCGSWLLMYLRRNPGPSKLYILNPLTRERINLPPLESRINDLLISESDPSFFRHNLPSIREQALTEEIGDLSSVDESLVLWVDDSSKDYLVLWSHEQGCLFFSKKGYDFWRMFPYLRTGCRDLVYKDHMLYIYSRLYFIEIYDFSGDSPLAVTSRPYAYHAPPRCLSAVYTTRIAVTTSGEVLMVRCCDIRTTSCCFYVYLLNHVTKTWDHMASLGDQALIFDLGITVSAKDIPGIKPDSIYFSGPTFGTKHVSIFNLATRKLEPFMPSTSKFFDARWFIPNV